MASVFLIFLSIERQRSAEKQWAFLMTGSKCAALVVSKSATVSKSRETTGEVTGWKAQQDNETANIYTFLE